MSGFAMLTPIYRANALEQEAAWLKAAGFRLEFG